MRITQSQLRHIIREELAHDLDEMAWAGHVGQIIDEPGLKNFDKDARKDARAAARYAVSSRFGDLARRYYANIPFRVWTAPATGANIGVSSAGRRGILLELDPDGLEFLKSHGLDNTALVNPARDFVIFYKAEETGDNIATPWRIFHAIFDGGLESAGPLAAPIEKALRDAESILHKPGFIANFIFEPERVSEIFTMRSAVKGIFPLEDREIAHEALCQELLTGRGFRYNASALNTPEEIDAMIRFSEGIKHAADVFRSVMPGKLMVVAVAEYL